ncbi:CWF19-like protein 1 [Lineus longissimus]|uniref:CWF19-like protein 1 n=1 Tax=Lineus longissimus TaxID=88925 RepID=UPI002B4D6F42
MSSKPLKILVSGDVEGKFTTLFSRVNGIIKKNGPFDLLICVGEFFHGEGSREEWEKYQKGELKVPMPILILGPTKQGNTIYYTEEKGGDLCENVTYLGRQGLFTGSSGLKIAYLSGRDGVTEENPKLSFNKEDVHNLMMSASAESNFKGVDVLLTAQWPKGVEKYAQEPEGVDSMECGSAALAQLVLALKPRYQFTTGEGTFYERKPYRNHKVLTESAKHVTRFIGLAKVGNTQKKKFLYAFNILPMSKMSTSELVKQPPDVSECPFTFDISSAPRQSKDDDAPQFFYDMNQRDQGGRKRRREGGDSREGRPQKKQPQPTGPCWFCLSSPEVEKHLVVSVAEDCYLALAKGGLTPDHVLILPIGHHQSTVQAPSDVIAEIEKYKSGLKKCFRKQGKAVVFFERNYRTQHLQIQAVPFPLSLGEDEIKEIFLDSAHNHPHPFELHEIPKLSDLKQIVPAGAPYFYVELPSGEKLLHRIKKGFPLQFGREVMASKEILDMEEKTDWKNCKLTKGEETEAAQSFRKLFQDFDCI